MSHAFQAGLFGGFGALVTGLGLEGMLANIFKAQTVAEAYLTKASSVNAETVQQAYKFADSMLKDPLLPLLSFVVGSTMLGMAAYHLAKSYERKE